MTDRLSRGAGQRSDDVMAAIYELVEHGDRPAEIDQADRYRPEALRQLDVPTTVDKLLQLTSRRMWLSITAVAIAITALLWYAATTVQVEAVAATGRAVALPGVGTIISPSDGVVTEVAVSPGQVITPGQTVAALAVADGSAVPIASAIAGEVWQVAVHPGAAVTISQPVVGLVPDGSGRELMLAVPESQAGDIDVSQRVDIAAEADGPGTTGEVTAVSPAPVPAAVAAATLATSEVTTEPVVLVTVTADPPVAPGSAVQAQIVQSERTLLQQLLGLP